jgi:hypothetical protein
MFSEQESPVPERESVRVRISNRAGAMACTAGMQPARRLGQRRIYARRQRFSIARDRCDRPPSDGEKQDLVGTAATNAIA